MEWSRVRVGTQSHLDHEHVHIWRIRLSEIRHLALSLRARLRTDETARADRFVRPIDRDNYTAGRAILREILGSYLQTEPEQIEIETGEFGKPSVSNSMNSSNIQFNLSHSGDICVIALRRSAAVGIDVEKVREDVVVEDLANQYFAADEIAELRALPEDQRRLAFFLGWTRKEAYVKAKASGLQTPLDQFVVTLSPGSPAEIRGLDSDRWTIVSLEPEPGYAGALVTEKSCFSASYYEY
jgi:4'-phosphopantetheinyl transferase